MAKIFKMPFKKIDIGVNLTDSMFRGVYRGKIVHKDDLASVVQRARDAGVNKMLVTAGNLEEAEKAFELAGQYDGCYATVGVHPTRCLDFERDPATSASRDPDTYFESLRLLTEKESPRAERLVVAIGECGLDYDRLEFCPKEVQIRYFERQFDLAKQCQLPMFLHNRNTGGDFVKMVRANRHKFTEGVVHSFDGPWEEAKILTEELGLYIGINGCSLKTEENLQVVKQIPVENMMIETDAPWCDIRPTHASYKYVKTAMEQIKTKKKEKFEEGCMVKGRNEPCTLEFVLNVIACVKEMDPGEVAEIVYANTEKVFFPNYHSLCGVPNGFKEH
ncbi:TatD DNase [Borealophlyctis nickersoniae]|nr:TatD DNase [Borealophlyctis nickersoniae]